MKNLGWALVAVGIVFLVGPDAVYQVVGFNTGLIGLVTILIGAGLLKWAKKIEERANTRS